MSYKSQGILQTQLKVKNSMNLENGFVDNPLLKSVEGEISLTDENSFTGFASSSAIEHLDPIKSSSQNAVDLTNSLNNLSNIKYIKLEGNFDSSFEGKFSGNTAMQKLDLSQDITIKPNDLAENENLKELPKLDFSNPDLTDIITNDTELKPTTIDLSNQNNTTRLGIHGDSTHQLGQLDFVKVNPEAPFDNTNTPQIDVSYTSLDKNGLVNLFNTIPYNNGYVIVGNPTVVDGVMSGIDDSNYAEVSIDITNTDIRNYEFGTEVVIPQNPDRTRGHILAYRAGSLEGIAYRSDTNTIRWYIARRDGTATDINIDSSLTLSPGDTVLIHCSYLGNKVFQLSVSKDNGATWTNDTVTQGDYNFYEITTTQRLRFGRGMGTTSNYYFSGSINLNKTYIKVNSQVSTGPVDYEVVGSPTIVNGVASGFSNDNYLRTANYLLVGDNDSLEIVFKLNNEEISTTSRQDILNTYSDAIRIHISASENRVTGYYNKGDGNRLYISYTSSSEIINGYFKFLRKGDTVSFSHSSDNQNWSTLFTSDAGFTGFNSLIYLGNRGYQHSTPINGAIDLNETYIKVNGKLWFGHESKQVTWFKGLPATSKVIKILGSTGESSLTNDDKAIATNKGWYINEITPEPAIIDSNTYGVWHLDSDANSVVSGAPSISDLSGQIYTTQAKFGVGSGRMYTVANTYTSLFGSGSFPLSGNYTVDFWIKMVGYNSIPQNNAFCRISPGTSSGNTCRLNFFKGDSSTNMRASFYDGTQTVGEDIYGLDDTAWHHVAWEWIGTTFNIYVDGTKLGSSSSITKPTGYEIIKYINPQSGGSGYPWIDELRISDIARYNGNNFVPPIEAYTAS